MVGQRSAQLIRKLTVDPGVPCPRRLEQKGRASIMPGPSSI